MTTRTKIVLSFGILLLCICAVLQYFGLIWHNSLFASPYEVKGLDVSNHQGNINWQQVKQSGDGQFVFIKATEGADFTDRRFHLNWTEARRVGMLVGAYHFFAMTSSGADQAAHFIKTVPREREQLPPVIDVEIHLGHQPKRVDQQLQTMLTRLEKHYGKRPLLYVTYETYDKYIKGKYIKYPIWIRDIAKFPTLAKRPWLFWQYHNRGHVQGINTYVDINVFRGDQKSLVELTK